MMKTFNKLRTLVQAEFLSPKDLLRHAGLVVALFAAAHAAGLREFTTIISGTVASPSLGVGLCALLGIGYMTLYFATVVLAPVLLIAAGLLKLWENFAKPPRHES